MTTAPKSGLQTAFPQGLCESRRIAKRQNHKKVDVLGGAHNAVGRYRKAANQRMRDVEFIENYNDLPESFVEQGILGFSRPASDRNLTGRARCAAFAQG